MASGLPFHQVTDAVGKASLLAAVETFANLSFPYLIMLADRETRQSSRARPVPIGGSTGVMGR
jgi:hypothetical protein